MIPKLNQILLPVLIKLEFNIKSNVTKVAITIVLHPTHNIKGCSLAWMKVLQFV